MIFEASRAKAVDQLNNFVENNLLHPLPFVSYSGIISGITSGANQDTAACYTPIRHACLSMPTCAIPEDNVVYIKSARFA